MRMTSRQYAAIQHRRTRRATQDTDDNGNVPFRRTIPKFDMELERRGQILAPPDTLRQLRELLAAPGQGSSPWATVSKRTSSSSAPARPA